MNKRQPLTCGLGALFFVLALIIWFAPPGRYPVLSDPLGNSLQAQVVPTLAVLPTVVSEPIQQPTTLVLSEVPATVFVATPIAVSSPAGEMFRHVVEHGETLFRIAVNFGVTTESLVIANRLSDPDHLLVGQEILIPEGHPVATSLSTAFITTTPLYPTPDLPTMPATEAYTPLPSTESTPPPVLVDNVNGISMSDLIVLPENVQQNIRLIYAQGQSLGRNPHAFSKLGDSTIENPHFLTRFDGGTYILGVYAYLQPVIDYFRGSHGRQGVAVMRGLHSWSVFDPMWSDKSVCANGETVIACEFRINNPSYLFIRLGSNDVGVPDSFDRNIRQLVEFAIQSGVIPIVGTKADRHEGVNNINNTLLRQIAVDYQVPLWDFDLVAATLPDRGLGADGVHMTTFFAHDYSSPVALQRGNGIHSLTAMMALDAVWRAVDPNTP
jgi:LysM repeat protein